MTETEIERLVVRMVGDSTHLQKSMVQAERSTRETADRVQLSSQRIEAFGLRLRGWGENAAASLLPLLGIGSMLGMAFQGVRLAADMEQMNIAFGAMIGNAEKAKETLEDLTKFAAETPFEMPEVVGAAKKMIAFGQSAETIVPTMRMIGDVAAGLQIPLGELTYIFGTLKSQGRAMTQDINQFAMRGIPIWQELEKITGKTNVQVRKMVEQGLIGFPQIEQAFKNMTGEGGRFGGLMEKQSQSLSGLFSTMKDEINGFLRSLGFEIAEMLQLKEAMKGVISLAQLATKLFAAIPKEFKVIGVILSAVAAVAIVLGPTLKVFALIGGLLSPFIALITSVGSFVMGLFSVKAVVLGIVGAFGAIFVAIKTAIIWLIPFIVGIGAILAVATLVAGTAYVILKRFGGIAGVFEHIKTKLAEFWAFIEPIRKAVMSLFNTISTMVVSMLETVGNKVVETWEWLAGQTNIDWGQIRDYIVDAILMAEFALLNFKDVATLVWLFAKWKALEFFNVLLHNHTVVLPAAIQYLADNWKIILRLALLAMVAMVVITAQNIITVFNAIPWRSLWGRMEDAARVTMQRTVDGMKAVWAKTKELVTGAVDFSKLWGDPKTARNATDDFLANVKKELKDFADPENFKLPPFNIPERQMTDLEKQWKGEFEALRDKMGADWGAFRAKKLAEFAQAHPEVLDKAKKTGEQVGQQMTQGAAQEIKKLDAALFFSAEATSRVIDYMEKLRSINVGAGAAAGGGHGGANVAPVPAVNPPPAPAPRDNPAVQEQTLTNRLIKRTNDILEAMAAKQGINLPQPANLNV